MRSSWIVLLAFLASAAPVTASDESSSPPIGAGVMGVGYSNAAAPPTPLSCSLPTIEGIDVSYYQGVIDWNVVKNAGKDFAFIRVSDGATFFDPKFDTNWASSKTAGLIRGPYQFFRASQNATTQADFLLSHVGALGAGDMAPVLDVEVTDGQSNATILAGIQTWTARIQSMTGLVPIIYTGPGFWSSIGSPDLSTTPLWDAHWTTNCPTLPAHWTTWLFWQYSSTGGVPGGITGAVDLDRFNGSLADLKTLTCVTDAATPSVTAPAGATFAQTLCE